MTVVTSGPLTLITLPLGPPGVPTPPQAIPVYSPDGGHHSSDSDSLYADAPECTASYYPQLADDAASSYLLEYLPEEHARDNLIDMQSEPVLPSGRVKQDTEEAEPEPVFGLGPVDAVEYDFCEHQIVGEYHQLHTMLHFISEVMGGILHIIQQAARFAADHVIRFLTQVVGMERNPNEGGQMDTGSQTRGATGNSKGYAVKNSQDVHPTRFSGEEGYARRSGAMDNQFEQSKAKRLETKPDIRTHGESERTMGSRRTMAQNKSDVGPINSDMIMKMPTIKRTHGRIQDRPVPSKCTITAFAPEPFSLHYIPMQDNEVPDSEDKAAVAVGIFFDKPEEQGLKLATMLKAEDPRGSTRTPCVPRPTGTHLPRSLTPSLVRMFASMTSVMRPSTSSAEASTESRCDGKAGSGRARHGTARPCGCATRAGSGRPKPLLIVRKTIAARRSELSLWREFIRRIYNAS
ncbi:hypothetical protein B0H16DRAFT_1486337 [Mycena metata]|uniref:Uncharacterized protein n=1 Tax=Mycena metata TaxID=1033252 RepID=A0AAD7DJ78_9AGAR|nr:hypothetical protein B0H16DRAFT_1486337 [Mycena metata]